MLRVLSRRSKKFDEDDVKSEPAGAASASLSEPVMELTKDGKRKTISVETINRSGKRVVDVIRGFVKRVMPKKRAAEAAAKAKGQSVDEPSAIVKDAASGKEQKAVVKDPVKDPVKKDVESNEIDKDAARAANDSTEDTSKVTVKDAAKDVATAKAMGVSDAGKDTVKEVVKESLEEAPEETSEEAREAPKESTQEADQEIQKEGKKGTSEDVASAPTK